MATCNHCGTEYAARSSDDRFCCSGCEFVAEMIKDQGFGQFYQLSRGQSLMPVRSRPFEDHDFSWLGPRIAAAEQDAHQHQRPARLDLALEGISCIGCVWLIEKLFLRHAGSIHAAANPANGRLFLEWLPGHCALEPFLRELCQFGYVAAPAAANDGKETRGLLARLGLCAAFAMNTMAFSLPGYLGLSTQSELAGLFQLVAFISATLSMLVGTTYFVARAWQAARVGALHIDLPIALGLVTAYLGSTAGWILDREQLLYFDFVSVFVLLMLTGRYVQTLAVERNRRRLLRAQPVPVRVPVTGQPGHWLAREELVPGSGFSLSPGQALPVTSVLAASAADFSLEWIHGEPEPQRFDPGARLPAGAILLSRAPVDLVANETWDTSLLAKLTAMPTAERVAPGLELLLRSYLALVLLLGISALIAWSSHGDWLTGLQAMISVFVVSCPCALGVSIPLADDWAAAAVERHGVFVRSSTLWARLTRIRRVIFDKTGTLTLERPLLANPEVIAQLDDPAVWALAVMTQHSLHPAARSLLESLGRRGQQLLASQPPSPVDEFPGLGVSFTGKNGHWSLGKPGWIGGDTMPSGSAPPPAGSELRHNGQLLATFQFHEALRPGALAALEQLRSRGLALHILSGDHPDKVQRMADALEIPGDCAEGGLMPAEKAARVAALGRSDALYLGDGANDALAFDAALVTGTPVVDRSLLEAKADFFTLGSGLGFLPRLLAIAASRRRAVRVAFGFALIYNLSTVAVAMAGHMSPLLAAIIMPLSSLISVGWVAFMFARKTSHQ